MNNDTTQSLLVLLLAAFGICALILLFVTPAGSATCMSLREARAEYPKAHLWKTRGCWGLRGGNHFRPHRKPQRDDQPDTRHVAANGGASARAEAPQAVTEPDPPSFSGQPMRLLMVPEYAMKKSDRLPNEPMADAGESPAASGGSGAGEDETPQEPRPSAIGSRHNEAWLWLVSFLMAIAAVGGVALVALLLKIYQPWRRQDDSARNTLARSDHKPAPSGKREAAGSNGARDQQPHFYPWHLYGWRWRTDQRRHAGDPPPLADRRDDFSALGAWARSRGFRTENETVASQPDGDRQHRKRFAFFGSR